MPYATGSGIRIHYEVEGSGPPLVVHPGFASSITTWYGMGYVDALKGQYTLVLIDPRGQGDSDKPHESAMYGAEQRVADVLAVLDAERIKQAHFIGYSMGGRVGYDLATQVPERFVSFLIGGAQPFGSDPDVAWAELLDQGMETFLTEGVERDMGPLPADVRARWLTNDAAALAAVLRASRPSLEAELGSIKLPALIFCGDQDSAFAPAKRAAELLPNATFVPLPGLNHLGAIFTTDAVLPHIRAFLQRVGRGAGAQATPA
jgi:pimeloyl-ACP methyl ester carboxylesterase